MTKEVYGLIVIKSTGQEEFVFIKRKEDTSPRCLLSQKDEETIKAFRELAIHSKKKSPGVKFQIVRFSNREVIEEF